jgi:hypothetical protein
MSELEHFITDRSTLSEQDKDLLDLALSLDHGTPLYKVRHFVGDAQITSYAKYKQLMLELRSREEIIEQAIVNVEKNKAQVELAKENLEVADSPAKKRLAELDVISNENDLAKTERRLAMAYKERDNFLTVLKEMYHTGEAYLADGTDLKDAMTDENLGEWLEAEHWRYRLGKQAALDIIAYGHVGTGNLEAISMMDEAQAADTLQLAITYSHGVKSALGMLEKTVLEAIESGEINSTVKIEKQLTPPNEFKKQLEN